MQKRGVFGVGWLVKIEAVVLQRYGHDVCFLDFDEQKSRGNETTSRNHEEKFENRLQKMRK